MNEKRLTKSSNDALIFGVCGGIAEYFGVDSTLVMLGFVAFSLLAVSGLLFYLIAAIVMPSDSRY